MTRIKILLIFLAIFLVACGTSDGAQQELNKPIENQDIPTLVEANNQLGFDLLSTAETDEAGNLLVSPSSLYFALSLAHNGATGETKQEMDKLLGFGDAAVLNESNHALLRSLTEEKEGIEFYIANSLWLNENLTFEETYSQNMLDYYQARIEEIDITDPKSVDIINEWVEEQTNERIQDIIEPPLNPGLVAFLINTIYFDGDWMYPFDPASTNTENFYLEDGSTMDVDMMTLSRELNYFETDGFQAVSLPYGEGEMNMQIYLPTENTDFENFQRVFTLKSWQKWQEAFTENQGQVKLPTFELEYGTSLKEVLQTLGMTRAFGNHAEFNNMVEETDEVWINEVFQKAFLLVDEEGTEAAATTVVEMVTESSLVGEELEPFFMEINRPFFLFITDEETGAILFTGKIAEPRLD